MYRRFLFIIVCIFMLATVVSAQETAPESLTSTPRPSEAMLFAQHSNGAKELAAEIYQNFLKADPEIFLLTEEGQKNIQWVEWEIPATDEEYAFVKSKAEEITAGLETDAEKIRAVAEYTALNVCYDYDYYEHGTKVYSELALTPYKILTEKNTVCEGYARLCEALLQAIDVPCIYVFSPDHSWNMAWDGTRWILFDSTWMSNCTLEYGKYKYSTKLNKEWYDFTFEEALDEYNHLILELPYTVKNGILTKYPLWSSADALYVYEGVEEISVELFADVEKSDVYLPKSLKRLRDCTFCHDIYSCPIERVYIDDIDAWLKIIFSGYASTPMCNGAELFVKGEKLTELTVPEDVTDLDYALFGCESLEKVILHGGITKIGGYTFYGCTNLRNINIPEGVTAIESSAFHNCTSLESVYIPKTVQSIGRGVFLGCKSLESVNIPQGITAINTQAFSGCESLKAISIPDSVVYIDDYAFSGCSSLSEISIPESVVVIGSGAFYNCSSLLEISIPESVLQIGDSSFFGCTSLKTVVLPKVITEIPEFAFKKCSSLTKIEIPSSVCSIGKAAFMGCEKLYNITIPENITVIESEVFNGCTMLENIALPKKLTAIGDGVFGYCSALSKIHIPEAVTSIGAEAFMGCISLSKISIPEAVTSIGAGAFMGCISLSEMYLPEGVTTVPEAIFRGCTALSDVVLHNGITSIGNDAFYGCSSLEGIILPNTLETIDSYAFYKCTSLTEITVPESLISIGSSALSKAAIKTVNYASDEEAWRAIKNSSSLKNIQLNCNVIAVNSDRAKTDDININGTSASAITGLSEGITAEGLIKLLVCSSDWDITVCNSTGEEISPDALIATGFTLCCTSSDGDVKREFLLSVYGDVNGDGCVNVPDITDTLLHIAGNKKAVYGFAVDKNSDGEITMDELNSFVSLFR